MIEERRAFFTPDGRPFPTRAEAEKHLQAVALRDKLSQWEDEWSRQPIGTLAEHLAYKLHQTYALVLR